MSEASWTLLYFNGTYNYSLDEAVHIDPRNVFAGFGGSNGTYVPIALGKANSLAMLKPIQDALNLSPKVAVFCGTDNVEELAFLFALNRPAKSTAVFVGAMFPFGHPNYDGTTSFECFMNVRDHLGSGAWVIVGDRVIDGAVARKSRSIGADAIGPEAEKCGTCYMSRQPNPQFWVSVDCMGHNVPIAMVTLGGDLEWLDWSSLDGLIVAGSGTGSIPDDVFAKLRVEANRFPVVVSTRCMNGPNHQDDLYPGSSDRYEEAGLIVKRYSGLNPLQARIRLLLELSKE